MIFVDRVITEFVDALSRSGIGLPQSDQDVFAIKDLFFNVSEQVIKNRSFVDSIVINENVRTDIKNVLERKLFGNPVFFSCVGQGFNFFNIDIYEERFKAISSSLSRYFEEGAISPIRFSERDQSITRGPVVRAKSAYNISDLMATFTVDKAGAGVGVIHYFTVLGAITSLGYNTMAIMAEDFSRPDVWGRTPRGRGISYVTQALINKSLGTIKRVSDILVRYNINIAVALPGGTAIIPHPTRKESYSWLPNNWPVEAAVWRFNAKPLTRPECFRQSMKVFVIAAGFPYRLAITVGGK